MDHPDPTLDRSADHGGSPRHPAADRRTRAIRAVLRLAVGSALAVPGPALSEPVPGAESAVARAETDALVAALRERVRDAQSATRALEGWCAEHRLALEPRLSAQRVAVVDKPPSPAQRARLAVGPDEPVRYRRVRLACGARVLSEADNWYVPARLSPEMNAALDGTDAPFGRVVRPLGPVRRTLGSRAYPVPAVPGAADPLFGVDALLVTGAGEPFCEVSETYLGAALPAPGR